MAQVANGAPDTAHYKFLDHLGKLPVVHDSLEQAWQLPLASRAGDAIKQVSTVALKYAGPIEPYLVKADSYADAGLREIENRFPIVKDQPAVIREKTQGAAKTTVDTYVGAAKDRWSSASKHAETNGNDVKSSARNGAKQADATIHRIADPVLTPILNQVEGLLDRYLPKSKAKASSLADDAKSKGQDARKQTKNLTNDAASKLDGVDSDVKDEAQHQINRAIDISFSLFDRSVNAAKSTTVYTADKVGYALGAARWSLAHPQEVPQAAYNGARQNYSHIRERVDGTVEITRGRASDAVQLAHSAREQVVRVFEQEQKSAPNDQPRGLLTASINTLFVLTKELLDLAKDHLQQQNRAAGDLVSSTEDYADAAAGNAKDVAKQAEQIVINNTPKNVKKDVVEPAKDTAKDAKDTAFSRGERVAQDVQNKVSK